MSQKHFEIIYADIGKNALSFDSGYAVIGVSFSKKSFMKLTPVANFIKTFWNNLRWYWQNALGFDSGYTTRSVNNAKKVLWNQHLWPIS
jgi:hypothetical protein